MSGGKFPAQRDTGLLQTANRIRSCRAIVVHHACAIIAKLTLLLE